MTKFGQKRFPKFAIFNKTAYDKFVRKFILKVLVFLPFLALFLLLPSPSGAISCSISIDPASVEPNYSDKILISSDSCNFQEGRTYTVLTHPSSVTSGTLYSKYLSYKITPLDPQKIKININLKSNGLGKNNLGTWTVEICTKDNVSECANLDNILAKTILFVSDQAQEEAPITPAACLTYKNGQCATVSTAIGEISTDPAIFVKYIFTVVLGLSGGIALILIIAAGYKLMMSQGNPEKVKGAGEQLTSAILGLLFIIFSFVILQVIGVDILRIPDFTAK